MTLGKVSALGGKAGRVVAKEKVEFFPCQQQIGHSRDRHISWQSVVVLAACGQERRLESCRQVAKARSVA